MMKKVGSWQNWILMLLVVFTGLILAVGAFVLWPSYVNPESRFYTSALGFLKVQRLLGMPMEVEAEHPAWHDFETAILGEGTLQSDFYNVPLVPTSRLKAVYVAEGDHVEEGEVLAKLDDTVATMNIRSAELALLSAIAQRQRVEAGTPTELLAERPDKAQVSLKGLERVLRDAQAKVDIYRKLEGNGSASRLDLVGAEGDLATAELNYNQAKVDEGMSNAGLPKSKEIAENVEMNARTLLAQRQLELTYCTITAQATGTIDRVLLHNGEYNQISGTPGFIIASDLWFEANLDQRALADLHEGMEATVNLEAYAGRSFRAKVERVIPIVTFNAGGPETSTPVRPLGTGSPEWPATFKVRLRLEAPGVRLAPGMTGFARVIAHHRKALAVPRASLSSLSAGKGVVRIVDESGHLVTKPVSLGEVDEGFVEITGDLDASDFVLTSNPRFLRDDDKIHITRIVAAQD
jgi:multidrug efflux pump subunit AcrA (membrane-fusion protein)